MNPINLSIRLIRYIRKQVRPVHIPAMAATIPEYQEPETVTPASSPGSLPGISAGSPASTPAYLPYRMKAHMLSASAESSDLEQPRHFTIMVCSELCPLPLGIIKMLDLYKKINH